MYQPIQLKTKISRNSLSRSLVAIVTLLLAAMAGVQIVHAVTITVMNTLDSGPGSLRQALAVANDGDTIDFGAAVTGTITLTSQELAVTDSITISGPGANILAVDGNHASIVFVIAQGKTVTISGLTISGGEAPAGGGIVNDHGTLTVSNCSISGNSAINGGGIFNFGFSGSATLTINNSTFSGNSATTGGGIYNNGEDGSATLTINNSTLSGNSASTNAGGGIFNDGFSGSATLTINNSTFSGNSATTNGGGIVNEGLLGGAALTVSNSTFSGNSASVAGGIYNHDGGGSATLTIGDTIIKAGASGANILNIAGTVTSLGYNLSSDNGGGVLTGPGDQINTEPLLGPLANNGGPTFTHALLSGSPAIDTGDPNFAPPPFFDQRGPGFDRVVNGRIDIGSFEVQRPRTTPTPRPRPTPPPRP